MRNTIIIVSFACITICKAQTSSVFCLPFPETVSYNVDKDRDVKFEDKITYPFEHEDCPEYDGWVLVFEDHFDGTLLNPNIWHYVPPGRQMNEGHNYFSNHPENSTINSGSIYLSYNDENVFRDSVDGDPTTNKEYNATAANLMSKQRLPSGKLEARYMMPDNDLMMASIWQWYENWHNCYQEIDGVEFYKTNSSSNNCASGEYYRSVNMNLIKRICGLSGDLDDYSLNLRLTNCNPILANDWFKLEYDWDERHVDWKLNGSLMRRMGKWVVPLSGTQINSCTGFPLGLYVHDFTRMMPTLTNMHIIMNTSASDHCEDELPGTPYPAFFNVDYIKYYTKINCEERIEVTNWRTDNAIFYESPTVYTAGYIDVAGDETRSVIVNGWNDGYQVTNQHLKLIATQEINLMDGFLVDGPDGNFEAIGIECNTQYIQPFDNWEEQFYQVDKSINNNQIDTSTYLASNNSNYITNYFTIYPNPSEKEIIIDIFSLFKVDKIEIVNSLGNIAYTEKILDDYQQQFSKNVDISTLPNGMYTVKIIDELGDVNTNKFIIKK